MMSEVVIYNRDGSEAITAPVLPNSVYHHELMTSEYVMIRFNSTRRLNTLTEGAYIMYQGEKWKALQRPTPVGRAAGGYSYEIQFHRWEEWKNRLCFYDRQGRKEKEWSLTQTPVYFLDIVFSNLREAGMIGEDWRYSVDADLTDMKVLQFNGTDIISALTMIAQAWETEWWVDGHVIHIGKCEYGTPMSLVEGVHIKTLTRSQSQDSRYCTRLYAFGSTRNLPKNYRKGGGTVTQGVVTSRLMLPADTPYIDAYADMEQEQIVEGTAVFEDIYPRRIGTIENVSEVEYFDEDEETGARTPWKAYRFKDSGIQFSEKYILPEQELKIKFQTGDLAGLEFSVKFNPEGVGEDSADGQLWEIIRNEEYTKPFPNETFKPKNGDEYILFGYDATMVSDLLVPAAEQELKAKAEEALPDIVKDSSTYECEMDVITCLGYAEHEDGDLMKDESKERDLSVGQAVLLISSTYGIGGDRSRIRAVEKRLDGLGMKYTIGASASYSRLRAIEQSIGGTAYEKTQLSGGGSGSVYLIRKTDSTPATDSNTFSALRIIDEFSKRDTANENKFLRKDQDDKTEHSLTAKNLTAKAQKGEDGKVINGTGISRAYEGQIESVLKFIGGTAYTEGLQGARFFLDAQGNWHLDIDYLNIHRKLQASEVEISHTEHIGGKLLNTAARCTIKHVVDTKPDNEDAGSFICFFEKSDSEGNIIYNTWQKEDLAYCETFNLTSGGGKVGNHFYWRKVVFTDTSADFYVKDSYVDTDGNAFSTDGLLFIVLGKTSALKAEYSDAPRAGDYVCQLGNTNSRSGRDGAIILASTDTSMTSSDGGSARVPYIRIYKGINTFTLPKARIDLNPYNPSMNVSQLTITTVGEEGDSTYTLEEYINGMLPLDKFDIYQIKEAWVPSTQSYAFDYTWESGGVTYTSEPYATWYENDEVDKHNQEPNNTVFLNGEGRTWRFVKDGEYDKWEEFTDPYLIEALRIAKEAKSAADSAGLSEEQKAQLVKDIADKAKADINDVLLDEEQLPNDGGVVCKAAILTKGKNAFIGTYKAAKEGNEAQMLSQSGLLTTDNYAEVFAEGLKKDGSPIKATMQAYITDEMSHVDIEADKVKITSGDRKLGDFFKLENGNVEMQDLKAKNITVEGVINNLIMDVDGNVSDKPLLIQNGEDGVDLDVLRCGSIIHLKNVAETHIRLPYYIYRDRGGTDHGRNQVQRTLTYYNTNEKHLMTTSELFQLVGKTITIIVDDTCTSQSFKINGKPYKQYIADGTGTDGRIDKLREQFSDLVNSAFNDEYVIDDFDSEQGISVSSSFIYQFTFKQGYTYMYRNGQIAGTCLAFYWQLRRAIIYGVNDDDNFWD